MPSPPYISPPPPSSSHHDGTLSVGVATGPSPTGPFRDLGAPLVHTPGMGNIDASFFRDTDGSYAYCRSPSASFPFVVIATCF